jgi:hypothetical protein
MGWRPEGLRASVVTARYSARAAALACCDDKLTSIERKETTRRYAGQAVGLLRTAVEKGFADGKGLRKDAYFDSIRDRADFLALQTKLERSR